MTFGVIAATVRKNGYVALADVTVTVPPGSVVIAVGGDGAGKTSLLRTMVGELVPQSGEVSLPDAMHIGYLPAAVGSWAGLTVQQNLQFAAGAYGLRGGALRQRCDELLRAAELVEAEHRPASQLSGGMRRKLGFCMAIAHRPRLLVLDEPTTGVDPVSRIDLWRMVSTAAADGAAVVMSTTYLDEAERAAHIVVLDDGAVLTQGSLESVLATFLGSVTRTDTPLRREWAWRRGRSFHEYWPDGVDPATSATVAVPDLEDVVMAASLRKAHGAA